MWYFSWVLGLGLACALAILNALWLELLLAESDEEAASAAAGEEHPPT